MDLSRIFKQGYCRECHNAYMRQTRKSYSELGPITKEKAKARSYANVFVNRGTLLKKPCEVCGKKAQMHHDDYTKPLEVRWFCRDHHLELHGYPQ